MPPVDLRYFPFSAVLGMDDAKRAMQCILVNPNLKTVLVRGGQGSAKTVLSRSVGSISGRRLINIPVNVSEEQLFGGMDIDATIKNGKAVMQPGLLSRADGNIVYVDDVNLIINIILEHDSADNYGNRAYITGGNTVSIEDLNALINLLLN